MGLRKFVVVFPILPDKGSKTHRS